MGRSKFKAIKTGGQVTGDPRGWRVGDKAKPESGRIACVRSRDGRKLRKKEYSVTTLGMWKQDLDSQREGGSSLQTQTDGEAVTAAELSRVTHHKPE